MARGKCKVHLFKDNANTYCKLDPNEHVTANSVYDTTCENCLRAYRAELRKVLRG
jgi:hypothetical protein